MVFLRQLRWLDQFISNEYVFRPNIPSCDYSHCPDDWWLMSCYYIPCCSMLLAYCSILAVSWLLATSRCQVSSPLSVDFRAFREGGAQVEDELQHGDRNRKTNGSTFFCICSPLLGVLPLLWLWLYVYIYIDIYGDYFISHKFRIPVFNKPGIHGVWMNVTQRWMIGFRLNLHFLKLGQD